MRSGIRVEDVQELEALIGRISKYAADLEEANYFMSQDVISVEEWFEGPNYSSFKQNWEDSSIQINRFLSDIPGILAYLNGVHGIVSDLINKKP